MKKIILVHGWEGNPNNCWFPWLKKELIKNDFDAIIPKMPNSDELNIDLRVKHLKKITGDVNQETCFVGHSIGCQAIMRYLGTLPEKTKIGGIVFVAGFFNLPFLKTEEEKEIAKLRLEIPIDAGKIKMLTQNIIAIFSDNDPDVSMDDSKLFKQKLNAKIIVERNKWHFSDDASVKELPVVLNEILKMEK